MARRTDFGAEGGPLPAVLVDEGAQVEADRHHPELLARRDSEPHEVVDGRGADPDQAVADRSESALEPAVDPAPGLAEVPLEHVAVVGVDDDGAGPSGEHGGEPAEHPRFRRVGVDDVGLEAPHDAYERAERAQVAQGVDVRLQRGHVAPRAALACGYVVQWLLSLPDAPVHEQRAVARGVEPAAQQAHVVRGPAHVEAGDHPQHPYRLRRLRQTALALRG